MANKSSSSLKWMVIAVIAALTVGGIWYFNRDDDGTPQYVTAQVTRGDITQTVTATGTLNPVVNVQVGSQISGIILALYADFNSSVTSNQVIAKLDPATYQANVHSAEGDLANARAALELAQVEARRSEELNKNKLISQAEYDQTMASLHQSEAQVKIKEAALENAKINLARCTIYSPVDGTVISRNIDIGQTVAASLSAPVLFQIANDLTRMQIDAAVSEADIGTIEDGQPVSFTVDAFPDRKFNGKVKQIRNAATTVQNVVTYDAVIEVSNPDLKLRPGMTANASIITAQRTGVIKVPNAALRFRPPEPSTNQTFIARMLAKIGFKETKSAATNAVASATGTGTNKTEVAASTEPPLTGNEPPEELMRRVREMRDRGEEVPPEIRSKIRELFQSGALQRPGGGGGGGGGFGGGGGGGGGGSRQRLAQPTARNIYLLGTVPAKDEPVPQPVRIRTGISDGSYTEVTEGLKEGDQIITSIKLPQVEASAPPGASPFGGGGFRGGGGGRGR
jgi:HlyD family secretion protein